MVGARMQRALPARAQLQVVAKPLLGGRARDDLRDEADAFGLRRVHDLAGQEQPRGTAAAP